MPYRTTPLINQFFYHIYNRGVEKRDIFTNNADRARFLKVLLYYQLEGPRPRFSRFNPNLHKNLKTGKTVDVISYCLMPNHFHFLLRQNTENGISDLLRKISNSYTKYFNIKYKRVGPLLQGSFKAVQVTSDEQLVHLSRYIHLNPYVADLVKNPGDFAWSSYLEFLGFNDNNFVEKKEVLGLFSSIKGYEDFINDQMDYAKSLNLIKLQILEDE